MTQAKRKETYGDIEETGEKGSPNGYSAVSSIGGKMNTIQFIDFRV